MGGGMNFPVQMAGMQAGMRANSANFAAMKNYGALYTAAANAGNMSLEQAAALDANYDTNAINAHVASVWNEATEQNAKKKAEQQ